MSPRVDQPPLKPATVAASVEVMKLAATLMEEGARTPADVFFSQDAGRLGWVTELESLVPAIANLAPVADSLWRALQRPVALDSASTTWLMMGLEQVSLAPVVGTTGAVRTAVVLTGLIVSLQPDYCDAP